MHALGKHRNVVMTRSMLFLFNVGHTNCYFELVTNVVYDNFQTPKVHKFSEHKIPISFTADVPVPGR